MSQNPQELKNGKIAMPGMPDIAFPTSRPGNLAKETPQPAQDSDIKIIVSFRCACRDRWRGSCGSPGD